jgi:hypothetical protein
MQHSGFAEFRHAGKGVPVEILLLHYTGTTDRAGRHDLLADPVKVSRVTIWCMRTDVSFTWSMKTCGPGMRCLVMGWP